MKIINRFTDLAGKHRATVEMTDGSVQMFKFQTEVSDAEVLAEANKYEQQLTEENGFTNEN